jgi:hypothetical protein
MVDALDLQHVERTFDVGRRAFFAGMGHHVQAQFAAAGEHARELLRRVAALPAVQPDADEVLAPGQRLLQRGKGGVFAEVAQEAQDQLRTEAELGVCARQAWSRPRITCSIGTPRSVCVCGSKKTSACTTLSAAARSK